MASLTQWTWVWASSGSWWRTGKAGVLQSMGSQRVRQDLRDWTRIKTMLFHFPMNCLPSLGSPKVPTHFCFKLKMVFINFFFFLSIEMLYNLILSTSPWDTIVWYLKWGFCPFLKVTQIFPGLSHVYMLLIFCLIFLLLTCLMPVWFIDQ